MSDPIDEVITRRSNRQSSIRADARKPSVKKPLTEEDKAKAIVDALNEKNKVEWEL
jgi:hypothetical protein